MNKLSTALIALIVAVLAAYGTVKLTDGKNTAPVLAKKETAYERVLRTGVLRCGWADYPPLVLTKDPNTGELKGIAKDIVETAAKGLSLKVEWTEEVGWGNWQEGLKSGRYDAFCATLWPMAAMGREVRYTIPIYYNPIYGYARADDTRFDNGLAAANDPSIRISGQDGEISQLVASAHFPKATYVAIPQLAELMLIFVNVGQNKADLVFNAPDVVGGYTDKNPGVLKRVTPEPFQFFSTAIGVAMNEVNLEHMLSTAFTEMHNNGTMEMILSAHKAPKDQFLRVARPYQPAQ
jgi:ABC-type amino acid transport substrate-binding protein